MSKWYPSGGQTVKVNTLNRGDYIRDPRKRSRILVLIETGATYYARGLDEDDVKKHIFLLPDQSVEKVTNVTTETSVLPGEGVEQN